MDAEQEPDLAAPRRKIIDPRTLAARFHHLKAAGLSGKHAMLAFQGDGTDTLARRLGSGAHALLFGKPVALWDRESSADVKRRNLGQKTSGKPAPRSGAQWKAFVAANPGAVILTGKEMESAKRIADAIHSEPAAERMLFGPGVIHERSIIWSQLGRARQSTPDARGPDHLVELKTTRCAAPWRFKLDAERLCYHAQVADQRAAIAYETKRAPRECFIVAVENVAPWCVTVFELKPSALEAGDRICATWLERLQIFEMTNTWGGYTPGIEPWEIADREQAIADPSWVGDDKEPSDAA